MRKIISPPTTDLSQGTIFNNAFSEDYQYAFGILISARCDIANNKINKFNYLPIVRLGDWLMKDCLALVKNKVIKSSLGSLRNEFKNKKISEKLIGRVCHTKIIDHYFQKKNDADRVSKLFHTYNFASSIDVDSEIEQKKSFLSDNSSILKEILNELQTYKNASHYFIEDLGWGDFQGYVILLREVRHLSKPFVEELKKGIPEDKTKKYIGSYCSLEEETYPLGVLNWEHSPFLNTLEAFFCDIAV